MGIRAATWRTRCALAFLALLGTLAASALAQTDEAPPADVGKMFRRVFTETMKPVERVQALERIVKEHPDSEWADDALWVLGEAARRQQLAYRVVYYWQYMMARPAQPRLEAFTRTLPLYRKSSLSRVVFLLEAEGVSLLPTPAAPPPRKSTDEGASAPQQVTRTRERLFLGCRPFNAVPMVVWAELGACYEQVKKPRLALRAYRKALKAAPGTGRWPENYRACVERLEKRVALLPPPPPPPPAAEQAPGAGGPAGASPEAAAAPPADARSSGGGQGD